MSNLSHTSILFCILLISDVVSAGQYDATALRGVLSPEPHFQTSQGREGHRFAGAKINKYRLYDFYARQAQYHLGKKNAPTLLLPYPGLEGGRRGHWGVTNEKTSSAELERTKEPQYVRLVDRGVSGNQHVVMTHTNKQSLCLFANASPTMSKVVLDAAVHTPEHPFSHKVDRYGFDLNFKGHDYLVGKGWEWHTADGKPAPVTNAGYHLHQDAVIFRRLVGTAALLDMARVTYADDIAVYHRHLEWRADTEPLKFPLPVEATLIKHGKIDIRKDKDTWIATISGGDRRLTHRVTCSQGVDAISLRVAGGRIWVNFPSMKKGTTIEMNSWISPSNNNQPALESGSLKLSELLKKNPRYFKKLTTVKGRLNTDPSASGTAYEIDDIPVPVDNPYGMPMTLSGITFSDTGDAYVCTLVGDVWKITGLDENLESVTWQRFASGLNSPLGLEMVDGVLHVITQHQILQLHDTNADGEADLVKPLTKVKFPSGRVHDLSRDDKGNFYFSHVNGIHKISADGSKIKKISSPARNPFGLAVRPDGLALSDSSEGNKSNGTCTIYESEHPENKNTVGKQRRILYLPRGIDNSPGSRIFMNSSKFGPLGNSLLGLSYGTGRLYHIMRDPNNGSPQAAVRLLPGEFSSGACRLETNPKDGQLYVVGLDGWGDFGITEGCLHRVRYTGKKDPMPVSWKSYHNGLSVRFNEPIDKASVSLDKFFVQQWNYTDSLHTYGSAEYSVKTPGQMGHDRIQINAITLSGDGKELFLSTPDIQPAMCTQIYGNLKSTSGSKLTLDLYATINQLPGKGIKGAPPRDPKNLKIPYKQNNGNTYAVITGFFDKRAGRDAIKRPVGPVVSYKKEDLNYAWVQQNILQSHACIACHQAGTQHDFSSHEKLLKSINLKNPGKSHLLGMVEAGSMPPYPMPLVAPEMRKALLQWIQDGAPKE